MLTAQNLQKELLENAMRAEGKDFTITKQLGVVESVADGDGNPLPDRVPAERMNVQMNAAALRMLAEREPSLKITYPQTLLSKSTVQSGGATFNFTVTRTDAVIEVPASFVDLHCGIAFQQTLQEEWSSQLQDLTDRIAKRLRKHEMRTNLMFGENPNAAAAHFTVTRETCESGIWTVPLSRCGLYPLMWDGEICGMALLLASRLKSALADDCGTLLETDVRRDDAAKTCTVTLYYSFKQE